MRARIADAGAMDEIEPTIDKTLLDCAATLARLQEAEEADRFEAAERGVFLPLPINLRDPWGNER